MEINRARTLAKVLARERALEARERRDAAIEKGRLADNDAYPGSKNFQHAVGVVAQYLSDLVEAKISSIRDAYAQTDTPLTGETVDDAMQAIRTSLETVISARVGSWGGTLALVQQRTGQAGAGGAEALVEAERELKQQAARLYEKAEAKLDVILQSSLAASEKSGRPSRPILPNTSRTATVFRVLIASHPMWSESEKSLLILNILNNTETNRLPLSENVRLDTCILRVVKLRQGRFREFLLGLFPTWFQRRAEKPAVFRFKRCRFNDFEVGNTPLRQLKISGLTLLAGVANSLANSAGMLRTMYCMHGILSTFICKPRGRSRRGIGLKKDS